ncbi:MAG: S8 family serine peptidase, partial [Calditrichia bacterium]
YDADIDAPEAWDISKGSSDIIVAVIDEGVEPHLDLPTDRITIGYNAINGSSGPNVGAPGGNENHGMACAGIIGATHDITGIAGLAPNCKIMPIRIADDYGTYTSLDNIAMAFDFTWDENINQYGVFADVISNSWGGYHDMSDPIFVNFREAVERAMTQGRNGKGCVVIWAAGNSPGQGISSQAKIEGVLAVGATDKSDNLQYYSPTGPEMDVVAPSGPTSVGLSTGSCPNPQGGVIKYKRRELHGDVWSIDRISARGWNPGFNECPENDWNEYLWTMDGRPDPYPFPEFTAHFGGTSASTPQVAGLAALILSIFPELDESSVRDIIKYSSEDLGPTGWDPSYGYGRINAYYAVAPPASPTNLSSYLDSDPSCVLCHNTQYSIKLDWDENNEPDFSHYIIYRSESSGNCNLCHETLNNPPEDSLSNPQSLNDSVTVEKDCPALSGEVSRFTKSKVEVETGCESGLESTEILTFEPIWAWPENFWIDIQIQGDFTYTYFVTAVDKIVEQESDESNFTIAYVPEGEGFSKPFVRFQGEVVPKIFFLYQNYPNPFNPATTIRFQVPEGMHVTIEIFDVLGQKVKTLVDGFKAAGYYSVAWDGKDDLGQLAPSGIYIYRMTTGDFVEIKTMLLLR